MFGSNILGKGVHLLNKGFVIIVV